MFINTQEFRREALYHQKHGKYDCGIKGSEENKKWWAEQRKRCLDGYSVGGVRITGYHYFYLNFSQIEITDKLGITKAGIRRSQFPKFWDLDYIFFTSIEIAKYGITKEELKKLPITIPLKEDGDNLEGGHHLLWLKQRGSGASWKTSSMAARNFHLVPISKTFLIADQKEYLIKNGVYSKFQIIRSWVNSHTEFEVSSDFKKGQTDMHFRASYDDGKGNELGMLSEVIGVTTNGDVDKARGKRGLLLLFEESGTFPNLDIIWNTARKSTEEGGVVYGTQIAFGTGGSEGADFRSMELMFDNPDSYNVLRFNNIYDIGLEGNDCGLFTPGSMNIQHVDEHGNSNLESGLKEIQKELQKAEKSPDVTLVSRAKAENPLTPRDAMLSTDTNKFAREELVQWRNYLFSNGTYKNYGTPKKLIIGNEGEVIAELETQIKPILIYPHSKKDDLRGAIVEYATPYKDKETGVIPDNLYIICNDPFADTDAQDTTSLGSAYVIMNPNNFVQGDHGNRIVASYNARPKTTDEYNFNLFLLARRWNAKIGFENDRGGEVIGYAKKTKQIHLLAPEFELAWDDKIATKNPSSFKYGMRIGSGKLNTKLLTGNRYIEDWLFEPRGETEDGKIKYNFHYIYDIALLDELRFYNGKGNYDRMSALRIGMFYMQELAYNQIKPEIRKNKHNSFSKFASIRNMNAA